MRHRGILQGKERKSEEAWNGAIAANLTGSVTNLIYSIRAYATKVTQSQL